ncbi:hypothetical protein LINPERPRIM_LOCUS16922 [Linum perenne]
MLSKVGVHHYSGSKFLVFSEFNKKFSTTWPLLVRFLLLLLSNFF